MNPEIQKTGRIKKLVLNIIASGLSADYDLEGLRKIALENLLFLVGIIVLPIFCAIAFSKNYYSLCIVDTSLFLFLVTVFFYLRKTKNHHSAAIFCMVVMGCVCFFFVVYGSIYNKTFYMWIFLYPPLALLLLGTVSGSVCSLLILAIVCTMFILNRYLAVLPPNIIEDEIRFGAVYISIYVIAFVMEKVRQAMQDRLNISNSKLEKTITEKEDLIRKLQKTIDEVAVLRGILPICSQCKKIRDDKGYWHQVETYFRVHSGADFTHSLCPECIEKLYPDIRNSNDS